MASAALLAALRPPSHLSSTPNPAPEAGSHLVCSGIGGHTASVALNHCPASQFYFRRRPAVAGPPSRDGGASPSVTRAVRVAKSASFLSRSRLRYPRLAGIRREPLLTHEHLTQNNGFDFVL